MNPNSLKKANAHQTVLKWDTHLRTALCCFSQGFAQVKGAPRAPKPMTADRAASLVRITRPCLVEVQPTMAPKQKCPPTQSPGSLSHRNAYAVA